MKHIIKSRSAWLGIALAVLPHISALADYLAASGAAPWVLSLVGVAVFVLRALTTDAVTLKPQTERADPVAFIIIAVMLSMSCTTAQYTVKAGDKEALKMKLSAPSLIEYRLNGKLVFSRKSAGKLTGMTCAQ